MSRHVSDLLGQLFGVIVLPFAYANSKCLDEPEHSCSHTKASKGAQWLSGRVLDSRPKGRGFEPHRRHCTVVLEQDTIILA